MSIKGIFKGGEGSVYTDALVSVMLWAVLFAVSLSALGAMAKKFTLIAASNDVKRLIEVDGRYDAEEQQKIRSFLSGAGVGASVTVSPSKDYYTLGETFTVTLSSTSTLGAGGIGKLTLPIRAAAAGCCEVYRK
jgi:hypothetical protein